MNPTLENQTTGVLLKTLRDDAAQLVVQHIDLAKTETICFVEDHIDAIKTDLVTVREDITSKVAQAIRDTAYLSVRSIVLYTGAVFMLVAFALGLNVAFNPPPLENYNWAGPFVVGLVTALCGFFMVQKAKKNFEQEILSSKSSIKNFKEKQQWASKQVPKTVM